MSRSRLGRAMRATAQDREASALMGVDMNQTIALTFLLGGALAAAAGVVWGLRFGYVRFDLGFNAGLKAFTAAVLGGIGNITGAVLGGFIIGFIENVASALGYSRWSEFLVFLILTFVLIFKPTGILGQHRETGHDRRNAPPSDQHRCRRSRERRMQRLRREPSVDDDHRRAWRSRRRCSSSCRRSRR